MSGRRQTIEIDGAAGDTTGLLPTMDGFLDSIAYEPDGTAPYDGAATLAVEVVKTDGFTAEEIATGLALSAAEVWRIRVAAQDAGGIDIAGSAVPVLLASEQVRLTVTGGTDGTKGKFTATYEI